MKAFRSVWPYAFWVCAVVCIAGCSATRKTVKLSASEVSQLVSDQSFVFIAERMNPLRGANRSLTSYYDVKVGRDTLSSYLPYFGRAYGGIIDPAGGGLQFTSTDYVYSATPGKGDSWSISIQPRDLPQIQSLTFNVFNNGTATLNVTSTNRDPISFYGYLQPLDKEI